MKSGARSATGPGVFTRTGNDVATGAAGAVAAGVFDPVPPGVAVSGAETDSEIGAALAVAVEATAVAVGAAATCCPGDMEDSDDSLPHATISSSNAPAK